MRLRYFFDPGAGICLWAADDEARGRFGYSVELEKLELSKDTIALGNRLLSSFDGSINWKDPAGPSLWSEQQRSQFMQESVSFYERLVSELGSEFNVVNELQT